ncbi:TRAP transporter substrate-binding protein [Pollutimonas thiosulfatoxidans]|uniref:C4-dicarboxylate ABC transporter n=1 Tax=Pollutimonas thiosulfatoxidans TaxID=2028345 RepID=A0A410GED6_9BURK|nr:TRAP transporter substrate-binding protein [Pollutimonas thiosulfatoxidans]QAA94662.1 hypothetical protein CKA81_13050 [Pollutimonas thiosulfatoxidans]
MQHLKRYIKYSVAALAIFGVTAPVALAQQTVRIAYVTSEVSPQHNQSKRFAEMIEERLPGQFTFRFYPNGQLGSEKTSLEQLQLGELEMANIVTPIMEADRSLEIFDLPFLFKDRDHARRALTPELRAHMRASIEKKADVEVLGIYENGFRHTMSRREIRVPDDMKGMKVRIAGGKLRQEVFRAMGANPTPIDWTEVFTALQTGVVDGAEAAIYGLYEAKLYQITPHLSLTNHAYAPSFLVASQDFWKKLNAEQKKAFEEAGQELVTWSFDFSERSEAQQLEEMAKYAKINKVEFEKFQAVTAPVHDTYAKQHGSEWLDVIRGAVR